MRPTLEQVRARVLAGRSTKNEYGDGKNRIDRAKWQLRRKQRRHAANEQRIIAAIKDGPKLVSVVAKETGLPHRVIGWAARISPRLKTYRKTKYKSEPVWIRVKQ